MRSDPRLKSIYRYLNKKYFNNSLPNIPVVFRDASHFKKQKWGGKRTVAITAFEGRTPILVALKTSNSRLYADTKMDLIHEMVHVAYPALDCSKKNFKMKMRELVSMGAFDDIF